MNILLTSTTVNLLLDLCELAGDVSGVAVEHRGVPVANLTGVVQDNDLCSEVLASSSRLILGVRGDEATLDVLDRDVLHVESNVVSGGGLWQGLVVHLHRFDLSGEGSGGKSDHHARLDDAGLNTANGHCSNATDLVNILEGETKGLVEGPLRGDDRIEGVQQGGAGGLALLAGDVPALVPAHVGRGLEHVVTMPPRDGDKRDSSWVVANLLDEARHLLLDLLEPSLGVGGLGGVHLVYTHNELLDSKGVGEQGVLTGLTVLGDAGLELSRTRGDDENSTIGLGLENGSLGKTINAHFAMKH